MNHVIIRYPEYPDVLTSQCSIANAVVFHLLRRVVRWTIHFNDQAKRVTAKVGDVPEHGPLPMERIPHH